MEEGDIEETNNLQEPLFRLLSETSLQESAKTPNPKYEDGKVLPKKLRTRFLLEARPCVPLEDIDPYYRNKQTFVVIGRWGTIHRFSTNQDGYLTLGPNNVIRRLAIYLLTNWIFSTLIVATLLLNIVALIKTQNYEGRSRSQEMDSNLKRSWVVDAMYIVDYVCLAVYCFELVLKIIARGFLGDAFTSFRDPWVYLDVIVIWTGFYWFSSFILYRKSTLWLRIFKLIPLIPSIRQAGKLSLRAALQLRGMMILLIALLWFFSLLGLQVYMGVLTQKCISELPKDEAISDSRWIQHNMNMSNWYREDGDIILCGNSSGSRICPEKYNCLQGFGMNPHYGTTSFDNVLWSLLSVIRIASEDFTEEIFRQILETAGPWQIVFFELIFFIITLPMGCLFFGILGNFFKESKASADVEMEEITGLADVHDFDGGQNPESLVITGKSMASPDELVGFRKAMHSFVFHKWVRNLLICLICLDIFGICTYNYGIYETPADVLIFLRIIPYIVFLVYTSEFILKMIALGPAKYFKNRWNHLDFIVLLTFLLEIRSYFDDYPGYRLAPIRVLKLIQYWPSVRTVFAIYYRTVKTLSGWILYTLIVLGFLVFIGPSEVGKYELVPHGQATQRFQSNDMPVWGFIDFWHSFRTVIRMLVAEWIETFWDCYRSSGSICVVYYFAINLCGALLISFLLVGVIYSTIQELQSDQDPSKVDGLRLLVRKAFGICQIPIKRIQPRDMMKNGAETQNPEDGTEEGSKSKDEKDGRRKKSIVAESTGQLRRVMQDCTESMVYKVVLVAIIIIASLVMIFENKHAGEDLRTILFVVEILFTIIFFVVVVYELLSFGIKESVTNRGWLFDALIVLEMILNLSVYTFSVTGNFRLGVFCIRSFRPLMLISRVEWLKALFRGLKFEVKMLWETVLAILFIWLFFDTFGVHWLAGLFHKCFDPETQKEAAYIKVECLARNLTWENDQINFDNSGNGFINMLFLASRMGWLGIINGATDAVGLDMPPQRDFTKLWFFYFIAFTLVGAFGALGILFSYILNKFQEDRGYNIILTESQAEAYREAKTGEPRQTWIMLEDEYIPPPEPACLRAFYNFVTNVKFDAFIMTIIIIDNVCISLDHYNMDESFMMVIDYIRMVILALYVVEMILKLISWGKHYFRTAWNWLDLLVVLTGILGLILSDLIGKYFFSPGILRLLRLFRIFRFLLAKKCGLQTAKIFLSAIINVRSAFLNLLLFQLVVMWAFAILGNYLFANVALKVGLNEIINFRSFSSSLWTLALLLGFPCLDGLFAGLSSEWDCGWADGESRSDSNCGNRTAAICYLGLYIANTFLVLLNLYSVLISEIIFEIDHFKTNGRVNDTDITLEDIAVENGKPGDDSGEIDDQAENGESNSENGE